MESQIDVVIKSSGDKMLDKYMKALDEVKIYSEKEIPIKISQFTSDRKLTSSFFIFLIQLKIIEKTISEHREGTIFAWLHKKAENESNSFLANNLLAHIRDFQKEWYKKNASKAAKEKNLKKEWEKDHRNPPLASNTHVKVAELVPIKSEEEKINYSIKFLLEKVSDEVKSLEFEIEQLEQQLKGKKLIYENKLIFVNSLKSQLEQ